MTLGNMKTSKPLTVDVNTTSFSLNNAIFSWKMSCGCYFETSHPPKNCRQTFTHTTHVPHITPWWQQPPLVGHNGLLNPPKMTESQEPFHGLQTPQIKIWTCVYALTNQSCFGAMSRTYTILYVVADQCILDCHDILNRHSLIPDGDFCRTWRSPDNSSSTTTKSTFLRGNIGGFIG